MSDVQRPIDAIATLNERAARADYNLERAIRLEKDEWTAILDCHKHQDARIKAIEAVLPDALLAAEAMKASHQAKSRGDDRAEQLAEKWGVIADAIRAVLVSP